MTSLLLDTFLDPTQREYVETIRCSGDALLTIINDILDFSKIDAGKLHLEVVEFDLRTAIEDVLELLSEQAASKGLEIGVLLPPELPTWLMGDPGRLRQVLTNLVGNAIKFTEQGEVFVQVSCVAQQAEEVQLYVEVSDTGIGISAEAQRHLFEAFTQADASTTSNSHFGLCPGFEIANRDQLRLKWTPFSHQEAAMTDPLSFDHLQAILRQHAAGLPNFRKPSPNTRYHIPHVALHRYGIRGSALDFVN